MPIIKIMEKKIPTAFHKISTRFAKKFIRLLVIFFYIAAFFGFNYASYVYTVRKESPKTFVRYNADNMPTPFPVLLTSMKDNKNPTVQLKEIYVSEDLDEQTVDLDEDVALECLAADRDELLLIRAALKDMGLL